MPIKFRCQHCNQLMGIARRKAGTDVTCPTCNGVLRVPFQDSDEAHRTGSGSGCIRCLSAVISMNTWKPT